MVQDSTTNFGRTGTHSDDRFVDRQARRTRRIPGEAPSRLYLLKLVGQVPFLRSFCSGCETDIVAASPHRHKGLKATNQVAFFPLIAGVRHNGILRRRNPPSDAFLSSAFPPGCPPGKGNAVASPSRRPCCHRLPSAIAARLSSLVLAGDSRKVELCAKHFLAKSSSVAPPVAQNRTGEIDPVSHQYIE